MKTFKKTIYVLTVLLLTAFAASCSTTGEYMPLKDGDVVIGTVQETLIVRSTFFFMKKVQDGINTEAYIKLLEAAERKYPNSNLDIRDIVWVTGEKTSDNMNTKVFVTGKVIRVGSAE
jgi:phage terminase large subunit-like protein